jgi:hypothetical protein
MKAESSVSNFIEFLLITQTFGDDRVAILADTAASSTACA